jgi:hypothetical protein
MRPSEPLLAASRSSTKPALWRRVFSFPTLLGVLLAAGAYAASSLEGLPGGKIFVEGDTWIHKVVGERIIETHAWPHADIYSFTAAGVRRIAYEWLGEVGIAFAARFDRLEGMAILLMLWAALLVLLLYFLAYLRCGNAKAAAVAVALALPIIGPFITLRPQLLGFCFLVAAMIGLELARRGRAWVLALFSPLFLIWVNTHSSFVLGFVVMGAHALEGAFDFHRPWLMAERWPAALRRKFLLSAVASFLVLFITPYGGSLAAYPLDVMIHQKPVLEGVTEWSSLLSKSNQTPVQALFLVLAMFVVGNYLLRPVAYALRDAVFLVGTATEAFLHARMLAVFAVAIVPVMATLLGRLMAPYEPKRDKPALNAVLIAGLLAVCAATFPSQEKLEGLLRLSYPVGTVSYLRADPSLRPVFNHAEWGGYLMHSRVPVFITGQLDIFEYSGTLTDYFRIIQPAPDAEALLRRYSIRACLLETHSPLAEFLERRPDWRLVSSDRVSVLFEYEGSPAAANGSGATIGRGLASEKVR